MGHLFNHFAMTGLIEFLERHRPLAPFQKRFVRNAFKPGIFQSVLSTPRGGGKSSLCGELLAAAVVPGAPLFVPGAESILLASSLEQARVAFSFLRAFIGDDSGYRFLDSGQRIKCTHKGSHTAVRVASSDAKRAFGLGANTPLIVADEPGSMHERAGSLMLDALSTSGGKADCRVVFHWNKSSWCSWLLVAFVGRRRRRLRVYVSANSLRSARRARRGFRLAVVEND